MAVLHHLALVAGLASWRAAGATRAGAGATAYQQFRETIGEARADDRVGLEARQAIFERRLDEIRAHNANPNKLWTAGLNRFADYTDAEFEALLGHRPGVRRSGSGRAGAGAGGVSFLQVRPADFGTSSSGVTSMDWSAHAPYTKKPLDQGACGSCWAFAAGGALQMYAELSTRRAAGGASLLETSSNISANMAEMAASLSMGQIVECTQNPQECGGKGRCEGATAELAFEFVAKHGLTSAKHHGYLQGATCNLDTPKFLETGGLVRLPENMLGPLLDLIRDVGPAAVSVDAAKWNSYQNGIFDDCPRDAIVNHAVLLVGFGVDTSAAGAPVKYWLVRNSWGPGWGEGGFIRVFRHDGDINDPDKGYCGMDNKPRDGVGCKGGPSEIPVCGMCGILSDSSAPVDVELVGAGTRAAGAMKEPHLLPVAA